MKTYSDPDGIYISIHAPREGGDPIAALAVKEAEDFNPRPPRGGDTMDADAIFLLYLISIHAPREGGD